MNLDSTTIANEALKNEKNTEIVILPNNKVNVSYKAERGNDPKPFVLPHFIELDENFIEGIGIYCGDGKLTINDLRHTEFTSKDSDLIKFILKFFTSRLNVRLEDTTISIRSNLPESIERWSRILKISKNKFKVYKHSPSPDKKAPEENLSIQINSVIFRKIYQKLIERILPIIKSESNLRRAFLRGHFAADGRIGIEKDSLTPYIAHIGFCYDKQKEKWLKKFILECLKLESIKDIKIQEDNPRNVGYLTITNWSNYLILWKMHIFDRNLRKKNKILEVIRKMKLYIKLDLDTRHKIFDFLGLNYTQTAQLLLTNDITKVSRVVRGINMILLDDLSKIVSHIRYNWEFLLPEITKIRIGNNTYLKPDIEFIKFVLSEKVQGNQVP